MVGLVASKLAPLKSAHRRCLVVEIDLTVISTIEMKIKLGTNPFQ